MREFDAEVYDVYRDYVDRDASDVDVECRYMGRFANFLTFATKELDGMLEHVDTLLGDGGYLTGFMVADYQSFADETIHDYYVVSVADGVLIYGY